VDLGAHHILRTKETKKTCDSGHRGVLQGSVSHLDGRTSRDTGRERKYGGYRKGMGKEVEGEGGAKRTPNPPHTNKKKPLNGRENKTEYQTNKCQRLERRGMKKEQCVKTLMP